MSRPAGVPDTSAAAAVAGTAPARAETVAPAPADTVAVALRDTVAAARLDAATARAETVAVAATPSAPAAPRTGLDVAPEQIGLWGLIGVLYPLLLLVGVRLLRIGSRKARATLRRRLDAWAVWLKGAGLPDGRVQLLRRSASLGARLLELAAYLLCIYAFSLYFFLLIPGTREFGIGMAAQLWPPLRAALVLAVRGFTFLAFAAIVFLAARWAIPRLRARLGAEVARPGTPEERERLIVLRSAVWLARALAVVVVIAVLPGPGRTIGLLVLGFAAVVALLAARRLLENLAAGFTVGRAVGARRGARVACDGCEGTVEEWTLTGLRLRADDGRIVHLPYRRCEEAPLIVVEAGPPEAP